MPPLAFFEITSAKFHDILCLCIDIQMASDRGLSFCKKIIILEVINEM